MSDSEIKNQPAYLFVYDLAYLNKRMTVWDRRLNRFCMIDDVDYEKGVIWVIFDTIDAPVKTNFVKGRYAYHAKCAFLNSGLCNTNDFGYLWANGFRRIGRDTDGSLWALKGNAWPSVGEWEYLVDEQIPLVNSTCLFIEPNECYELFVNGDTMLLYYCKVGTFKDLHIY